MFICHEFSIFVLLISGIDGLPVRLGTVCFYLPLGGYLHLLVFTLTIRGYPQPDIYSPPGCPGGCPLPPSPHLSASPSRGDRLMSHRPLPRKPHSEYLTLHVSLCEQLPASCCRPAAAVPSPCEAIWVYLINVVSLFSRGKTPIFYIVITFLASNLSIILFHEI